RDAERGGGGDCRLAWRNRSERWIPLQFGNQYGFFAVGDVTEENDKPVPAVSGHQVAVANRGGPAGGQFGQHGIAHGVAVGVVHLLEVVEVEKQQCERRRSAAPVTR